MEDSTTDPVLRLVSELTKLPGIGEKSATRMAYFILKSDIAVAQRLSHSILDAREKVRLCAECMNFSETDTCSICADPQRIPDLLCVVEKPSDVVSIESSGRFRGRYHVLHGLLSPLDGIGPAQLYIQQLLRRLERFSVKEVILALNSSVEADATGVYLTKLLRPLGTGVSRIAHGIPVGGVLEYLDRQTIARALDNRVASP